MSQLSIRSSCPTFVAIYLSVFFPFCFQNFSLFCLFLLYPHFFLCVPIWPAAVLYAVRCFHDHFSQSLSRRGSHVACVAFFLLFFLSCPPFSFLVLACFLVFTFFLTWLTNVVLSFSVEFAKKKKKKKSRRGKIMMGNTSPPHPTKKKQSQTSLKKPHVLIWIKLQQLNRNIHFMRQHKLTFQVIV